MPIDRQQALRKAHQYRALQSRYQSICQNMEEVLTEGNEYHIELIELGPVDGALTVLDHPVYMNFEVFKGDNDRHTGAAVFRQVLADSTDVEIIRFCFDHTGNPKKPSFNTPIDDCNYIHGVVAPGVLGELVDRLMP